MSRLPPTLSQLHPIAAFTAAYMMVATVFALKYQNWEFAFYIGVMIFLIVLILTIHRRTPLTYKTFWCLSIWGGLHMLGGLAPIPQSWPIDGEKYVFYSWWLIPNLLKYDHIVHGYGFGIATWVCWQTLRPALRNYYPTTGIILLCAIAGMGLGTVNEIIEFFATLLITDTNVGGYENTGWDLVANAVGSLVAMTFIGMAEGERVIKSKIEQKLHKFRDAQKTRQTT
ncbi:hypothetical protein A2635_04385 [Candidatus Peribacteria bacterium RIFCSPHIGHO2_01_FULL_51_9]|nr:MAG: hypothetical protein A2635_04385 [Candidatus Peribacteria bacterium RIFCSPHIGHO2_01_FULL_51_9]